MKNLIKAFMRPGLFIDLLTFGGIGMIFFGLNMHWPWLAWTVSGALLMALGLALFWTTK